MKAAEFLSALSLAFLLSAGSAYAQDPGEDPGDEGELTIRLIPDPAAGLPEAVTKPIALPLPDEQSGEGMTRSADGLIRANARLTRDGRVAGLAIATDARNRGSEFGADMALEAQSNRENFSRGNASDLPARPDLPNLPGGPNPNLPNPNPPSPPGPPGP